MKIVVAYSGGLDTSVLLSDPWAPTRCHSAPFSCFTSTFFAFLQ